MTVSLAMLVLDPPIDRLAALIELLRPIITDCVIVVDDRTESETVAIMSAWRDVTIVPFRWVDDFSAARNAALSHCRGDWVLHLDPDELPSLGMIDFIRSVDAVPFRSHVSHEGGDYAEARGYLFWTTNYFAGVQRTEPIESDWHCRLFRRLAGAWYKPVHEQVMIEGHAESHTRGTDLLLKAPRGAPLIHSKPASRIGVDDAVYARIEAHA